ncbi:hypothetical protein ACFL5O_02930 [Myxococcota bacterium]
MNQGPGLGEWLVDRGTAAAAWWSGKPWFTGSLLVLLGASPACGGRTTTESGIVDVEAPENGNGKAVPSDRTGHQVAAEPGLDECIQGFDPAHNPSSPCPWLTAGLCYETYQAACECACAVGATTCVIGFYAGPAGRSAVLCF